jgi:tetratricopeptide (TPR) repeat protein
MLPWPKAGDFMSDLDDRANDARRLGLMIVESRTGHALAAAIPHLREAADLWGKAQRMVRRAECLIDLGRVHRRLGQTADAATVFAEALGLVEDESDLTQAITAASEGGLALLERGELEASLTMLRRAEALADRANDHLQLAQVRHDLSRCHLVRREASAAQVAAASALATFTAFRKGLQRAACEERLAEAAGLAGNTAEAAKRYEAAVSLLTEMGRLADVDEMCGRWADYERDRADFAAALRIDEARIARHAASGNRGLQIGALIHYGMVQAKAQDAKASLATFRKALALAETCDDRASQAKAQFHIGAALIRTGDAVEGLRRLLIAAELAAESKDQRLEEESLAAVIAQQRTAGDGPGALATMRRWVDALRRRGDREHEIQVLGDMVEIGRQTGHLSAAEESLRELIAACGGEAHRPQLIDAHHHLGVMMSRRGDLDGGLDHLRRSLALIGDQPSYALRSQLLARIGNIELKGNRPAEALKSLQAALASNPDEKLRPRILVDLGNAQAMLGKEDEAIDLFEQAAKVAEKQGDMRATTIIRRGAGGLKK